MLAVGLSLAMLVLVGEVGLRVATGPSDVNMFEFRSDTLRYRIMKPNTRGLVYGVPIETNSAGFRSTREYSTEKPPNIRRIVVLGDSMTVCAGVPFKSLTTTRLEGVLGTACSPHQVEVFNLGCGGYGILHHVATLKECGLRYRPDLVLLFLFPDNDFEVQWYESDRQYVMGNLNSGESLPVPETQQVWFKSLYMYRVLSPRVVPLIRGLGSISRHMGPSTYDETIRYFKERGELWQRSISGLREIVDMCQQVRVPVAAILLPGNWGTYDMMQPFHDAADDACKEAGLSSHQLIRDFRATNQMPGHFRVRLIDNHPNEEYGEIAAQAVYRYLCDSKLLGAFCGTPNQTITDVGP